MTRWLFLLLGIAALAASAARAQSGGGFELTWSTIDGGGAMNTAGGSFELAGTIGQPDAQPVPVMTGGTFELTGGFWAAPSACHCPGDMDGDGQKNGEDIQQFVGCLVLGEGCFCADIERAGGVTPADIAAFVAELLAGETCPA